MRTWFDRNKIKIGVVLLTVLLLFYLVLTLQRAYILLIDHSWVAKAIGAAYLVLPLLGAYLLYRELYFGAGMQRMARKLEAEGTLPVDTFGRSAAGRIDRAEADRDFVNYQREAEAAPEDWRVWYRLALAYDASSDRKRARSAMREAWKLYHQAPQEG